MRFDRSIITAPIGRPVPMPGGVPRQKTPVSITRPSDLEFGRLQERLALLENREIPTFDPTALQQGIAGLQDKFSALPKFDDSILRDRIRALESREIPVFDPSELKTGIAGLQDRISNIPQFDPSQLQQQIQANRDLLGNIPQFDDSALQDRLQALESRKLPTFNPEDFRDQFLSIAREGIDIPQPTAPDLSGFARLEDLQTFDDTALQNRLQALENREIPQPVAPDLSGFAKLEDIPTFDREALIKDIRSGINIPKPPSFDREKLIEDIRGGLDIPKPPSIDRDALIADIQNRIKLPEPLQPFDPSGLQSRLGDLEKRLADLSAIQPLKPVDPIVGQPGQIEPVSTPIVEPEPIQVPEPLPPRPPSIGGIGGINQDPRPLERPIIPPKRDDFMSIDRIPNERERVLQGGLPVAPTKNFRQGVNPLNLAAIKRQTINVPGGGGLANETAGQSGTGTPPPQTGLTAAELLQLSDEELRKYIPRSSIGNMYTSYDNTPSPEEFREQLQRELNPDPNDPRAILMRPRRYRPIDTSPQPTQDKRLGQLLDIQGTGGGTDPVTTPTSTETTQPINVSNQDPFAAGVTQIQSGLDPLTEQLLFGIGGQGGFIPGAMRAAEKVFYDEQGNPVVIDEQVAGFSPDQLAAMQMQRDSLGIQNPFLQGAGQAFGAGTEALEEGLQRGRTAAIGSLEATKGGVGSLQSGLGESADILRGTLGGYDPSMTDRFYDPFEDQVVQQTIQDIMEQGAKSDIGARASDIARGGESAFGSRARLGASERQEALGRGLAEALGGIRSRGFQQAQQTGLGEFARQKAAERAASSGLASLAGQGFGGSQALAGALSGLGQTEQDIGQQRFSGQFGLGTSLQGLGAQAAGASASDIAALYGMGSQQQQQTQQMLDAQRRNMQQRQMTPLLQYQALAPFISMAPAGQFQTTTQFAPPPSPMQSGLSTGLAAFGALGKLYGGSQ